MDKQSTIQWKEEGMTKSNSTLFSMIFMGGDVNL